MTGDCQCKGVCGRYSAKLLKLMKPFNTGGGFYHQGLKRCGECRVYIKCDKLFCPCCGRRLQHRPHNRKYKNLPERLYL
jgi:hypothetical protein